jgi:hypothetical protein
MFAAVAEHVEAHPCGILGYWLAILPRAAPLAIIMSLPAGLFLAD